MRDDPPLDIVSIDNLPSVLALEASHAFADLLLPALMAYPQDKGWSEAQKVGGWVVVVVFAGEGRWVGGVGRGWGWVASHAFADLLLPALLAYPQDKGCCQA